MEAYLVVALEFERRGELTAGLDYGGELFVMRADFLVANRGAHFVGGAGVKLTLDPGMAFPRHASCLRHLPGDQLLRRADA